MEGFGGGLVWRGLEEVWFRGVLRRSGLGGFREGLVSRGFDEVLFRGVSRRSGFEGFRGGLVSRRSGLEGFHCIHLVSRT